MVRPKGTASTRGRISRILCTTYATILCFNKETKENEEFKIVLDGEVATDNIISKAKKDRLYDDKYVALDVIDSRVDTALYAISIQDFVAHAERIEMPTENDK